MTIDTPLADCCPFDLDLPARRLLEELDLICDAYNSLQAICAASDVEASTVFAILHQLNLNYRRALECFGVPL